MDRPFDLRFFLIAMVKHWKVLIAGILAGSVLVGGGYLLGKLVFTKTQYEMRFVVHENLWYNDELGEFTYINAYTWTEVLGMDMIAGSIADSLGDGYTKENVAPMLRAEMPSDTRVVYFYVKGEDRARIRTVYEKALELIPEVADILPEIQDMVIMDRSTEPYRVNMITYWHNAFILGAILGLILTGFGLGVYVIVREEDKA